MKDPHFDKIFWLCAYVVTVGFILLAGLIWLPVPQENQSMANLAMGFITATIIGVPLAYIFGGNPTQNKKPGEPGTTSAEIHAEIISEPKNTANE